MKLNLHNYNIFRDIIIACLDNHEDYYIKQGLEEMIHADKEYGMHRPRTWKDKIYDDLWSILVNIFGEYGTSPRSGWIEYETETCECIKQFIHEYLEVIIE